MLLRIEHLAKRYPRGATWFSAVDNVSFSLESGAFVARIGRSGSGKTTLLNMLTGLRAPDAGEILWD